MRNAVATEELREALRLSRVVPVVGAGVSISAAQLPSWHRLIEDGVDYAEAGGGWSDIQLNAVRANLRDGNLVSAASGLKGLLGAPHGQFPMWLERTCFRSWEQITDRTVLNAIADLLAPVIATTNYDHLLEQVLFEHHETATWKDPKAMLRALSKGRAVLHLHGSFLDSSSVVLGADDYDALTKDESYRSVLQTLWLDRVLLFVGCSLNGLQDPDFTRMIKWFAINFPGAPHRHFALMLQGSFTHEEQREWLLKFRVQVIAYGPTHDDLPKALEALNVNAEKAYSRRIRFSKALMDGGKLTDSSQFAAVLEGAAGASQAQNAKRAAEALFAERNHTQVTARNQFAAMQHLARSLVNPEAVSAEMKKWDRGKTRFEGVFRQTVLKAASALYLFEGTMLNALKQRQVHIHESVLRGTAKQMLDDLEHFYDEERAAAKTDDWTDYQIENMNRILITIHEILSASPEKIFPDIKTGHASSQPINCCLLVVWKNRLEIRSQDSPEVVRASLTHDSEIRGGCLQWLRGKRVAVAFSSGGAFVWDPQMTSPLTEFAVSEAYGINSVDHYYDGSTLHSVVTTIDGGVYRLENFDCVEQIPGPRDSFLSSVVFLPDGRILGLRQSEMQILLLDDGHFRRVLDWTELDAQICRRTLLSDKYMQRMKEAAARFDGLWDPDDGTNRFQHPSLTKVRIEGRWRIVLSVQVNSYLFDHLILLLDPDTRPLQITGHFWLRQKIICGFEMREMSPGAVTLICALLSDFKLGYDLITWARGAPTAQGLVFVDAGSTLRTRDDLISVVTPSEGLGFAADGSGGLFQFSLLDKTWREIDRDPSSRIRGLVCTTDDDRAVAYTPPNA